MYVGLYQQKTVAPTKKNKDTVQIRFLGDFELDLSPYFMDEATHPIHFDLRNYKELRVQPNYMFKDMRKKGGVDFDLKIRSNIRQFCIDNKKSR